MSARGSGCAIGAIGALAALLLVPGSVRAQAAVAAAPLPPPEAATAQVTAALVPAATAVRPGDTVRVALRLVVAPGWHVGWIHPGQTGLPTTVAWELPAGMTVERVEWPAPARLRTDGLVAHAYTGEVVALATLRTVAWDGAFAAPLPLRATVRWGVCREVCIPQRVELGLALAPGERTVPAPGWDSLARAAARRLPLSAPAGALRATWAAGRLRLRWPAARLLARTGDSVVVFPMDRAQGDTALGLAARRDGAALELAWARATPPESGTVKLLLVGTRPWIRGSTKIALEADVPVEGTSSPR